MKHQKKFDAHIDEQYSPVKIYDRLYPFSEVLAIRRPDLYAQMYYQFTLTLNDGDTPPPAVPSTARPNRY